MGHARWLTVAMTVAAAGLGACGDDGGDANGATTKWYRSRPLHPARRREGEDRDQGARGPAGCRRQRDGPKWILPRQRAFLPRGKFSGGHGNTALIDRTFECPDGSLRIGFIPGDETGRTVSGRWKVLSGTGAFKGMKGSGRMQTRFAPGAQPATARETFTGSVVR